MSLIKRVLMTEKTVRQSEMGCYTFEVARNATKEQIRRAVENLFGVEVKSVNTLIARGKTRWSRKGHLIKPSKWKKAVVTLKEGQKIALFEGV
ncbi:MAG: 50S ribosomal protein L23 [Bdellovibrionaceae bacterium]|nr:50S ribosomal protein L23 [Pseudobdellovibrionaceae bacterium]MDW8190072.1 50S ribosomal protein L23 [Pseudobdellovibrionaceae bacterium]